MEFHQKLRRLRKERGMSQEDLAGQLNVSRQAVSIWENGQGYPETEKLLMISTLFHVSLDYLLKDDGTDETGGTAEGYYVSREMVEGYLFMKKKTAIQIAAGVSILIFSLSFPILFPNEIGTILFLLGAAAGIVVLVLQGFQPKRFEAIEKQPLVFDSDFLKAFKGRAAERRMRYGILIAIGVALIIVSLAFGASAESLLDLNDRWLAAMPPLWAISVAMFVFAGSVLAADERIASSGSAGQSREEEDGDGRIYGVVMPLAVFAYLAIGFIWNAWHPGWLIIPVAAIVCRGITALWHVKKQAE